MNENTKIIANPAMTIMKKQKRERERERERDQLERKTKETHSRRSRRLGPDLVEVEPSTVDFEVELSGTLGIDVILEWVFELW